MMCVFLCILSQFHVHDCELSQTEIGPLGVFTPYSLEDDTNQGIFSPVLLQFFFSKIYQGTATKQNKNLSILSLSTSERPMLEYYRRIHMDGMGS